MDHDTKRINSLKNTPYDSKNSSAVALRTSMKSKKLDIDFF